MKPRNAPPDGTVVRFEKRDGRVGGGVLKLIWMCQDEWCWDVVQMDGTTVGLFPGMGDKVEWDDA